MMSTDATATQAESGVQVISRAAQILRALSDSKASLSLSDLARKLDLPRSTVHRIVTALETEHLVGRAGERDGYRLGMGLIPLGQTARHWIGNDLRPQLTQLSQSLNETVDVAVREGDTLIFVDQFMAQNRLQVVSGVGLSFPLHCTANGKALLAELSDPQIIKLVPATLEAHTPKTITDRKRLLKEIAQVRESKIAFDREEYTTGICAIGTVVNEALKGSIAISVPVPAQRFYGQEERIAQALLEAIR
jgi:DNA-binding IclR family transcriptional regulator